MAIAKIHTISNDWAIWCGGMNQLINYLHSRLGKRTCPIIAVETVHNFSYNYPFRTWFVIKFKDGTKIELIEKPKFKGE